jgi:hypothetical protein
MFNTCITQDCQEGRTNKKVDISKNCTILQRFGGSKNGSKFSTNAYDFHVLKNSLGLSETKIDEAKSVIRNVSEKGLVRGFYLSVLLAKLQSLG